MYDLIIVLSRYLFVFYIGLFLYQGIAYVLAERNIVENDKKVNIFKQRWILFLFHINAFMILVYEQNTDSFSLQKLSIGLMSMLFFIFAFIAIKIVYKNSCQLLWNGVLFLMDVGIIMLTRLNPSIASRQLLWFLVGFLVALLIPLVLYLIPKFEKLKYVYLIFSYILILLPSFMGSTILGADNWIRIYGVSFQPSEIVKFLFVFYLASVFRRTLTIKQLIFPSIASAGLVLILVIQRDLGAALIYFTTFMTMMYASTGNNFLFLGGLLAASVATYISYEMFSHVRVRVTAWLNPWADPNGNGYQILQSLFAIGTWGILGSGLTRGYPSYIPIVESDFIFAAIAEEFGAIFVFGLIGVYIMVFYRGVHVALRCHRRFYSVLAAGFTAMLTFQTFLIIGGNIKLIPLTGVTLPLISQGGSSVLANLLIIGIIQWIYMYYHEDLEKEQLEYTNFPEEKHVAVHQDEQNKSNLKLNETKSKNTKSKNPQTSEKKQNSQISENKRKNRKE